LILDWTIHFSDLFTVVLALLTVSGLYFGMKTEIKLMTRQAEQNTALMTERLGLMGGRIINVEMELKELTKVLIAMAETSERLKSMDARLIEHHRRINNMDEHGTRLSNDLSTRVTALEQRMNAAG
jgi:hypothetical protein